MQVRLLIVAAFSLFVAGCGTVHNAIGPDSPRSSLRDSLDAPYKVSMDNSAFCEIDRPIAEEPKVIRVADFYHAVLYFKLDSTQFSTQSLQQSAEIYQQILSRNKSQKITLIGHTDTLASSSYNDALSDRRANKVKDDLLGLGIDSDRINTVADGEKHLKIPTQDNTAEQLNRRVEIDIR